ncbi:MAG: aldehyde dehydrogenase [Lachnospiraceae bacterium]|nr:aldehyde dehydrogenase [Lachnospiraceae bacterium]
MTGIEKTVKRQQQYFATGKTKSYAFRMHALLLLEKTIRSHEKELNEALKKDLNKAQMESYMTETGMVLSEINYLKKHLFGWMQNKTVRTPLAQFPSHSFEMKEPYGVVLVMAPWNYPFMLLMEPLAGALAAGNCAVVKPSAYSPHVSAVIKKMLEEVFPAGLVAVVEGGRAENKELLDQKFDYIFFTGGVKVGQLVLEKAARHLTPVTLELGGKSPCIVDQTANIRLAARRIVFGKYLNAGQTCVAPDYILVHESVKDELVKYLKFYISVMLGEKPLQNEEYPKIINEKHYDRLMGLLEGEHAVVGGKGSRRQLKIEPTVLTEVTEASPVMQEEIFGPILPVLTWQYLSNAEKFINSRPKPLALYLFTRNRKTRKQLLKNISFGGGCVNDTIIHLATSRMGFGGVGGSGMGSYHGKYSFDTFSHTKSIVKKSCLLDLPMRYHPYTFWKELLVRMFMS